MEERLRKLGKDSPKMTEVAITRKTKTQLERLPSITSTHHDAEALYMQHDDALEVDLSNCRLFS